MTIEEQLKAHIEGAYAVDAEWGKSDCTPWAGEWLELRTGRKIEWPVQWSTQDEAMSIIGRAGSLVSLWDDYLFGFGLSQTGFPALGDIGVVDTGRIGQVGGIFLAGGYFVWRIKRGVMMIQPREIAGAWSIPR
ncbi:DUF6950 family protein [Pararhizobium gei]|uniref:DUF6950 family protein n=1 Tax=Pararhizobium gei TaxID=1395951 RepID=UPI0023DBAD02|nr:hypothetical protein [Rhizobium gei]